MIHAPDVSVLYIAVLFGIAYWILRVFLFAPVSAILDAREQESLAAEKIYLDSVEEHDAALRVQQERLAVQKRQNTALREQKRAAAQELRRQRLAAARAEAQERLAGALAEIEAESTTARASLGAESERLGREIAGRLLGRAV